MVDQVKNGRATYEKIADHYGDKQSEKALEISNQIFIHHINLFLFINSEMANYAAQDSIKIIQRDKLEPSMAVCTDKSGNHHACNASKW